MLAFSYTQGLPKEKGEEMIFVVLSVLTLEGFSAPNPGLPSGYLSVVQGWQEAMWLEWKFLSQLLSLSR